MGKEEILFAVKVIETMPDIKNVFTFEIDGVGWVPFIGIKKKNGDLIELEGIDEIISFINNFKGGVVN